MKKVWILEKFESNEMMVKTLGELEQMFEENKSNFDAKGIESMNQTIASHKKRIEENPEGMWIGWEGKSFIVSFVMLQKLHFVELISPGSSELLKVKLRTMHSIGVVISSLKKTKEYFVI